MPAALSAADQRLLLCLARAALEAFVRAEPRPTLDAAAMPPALLAPRACFVTLSYHGRLRGCLGGLVAAQPLYLEACQRARQVCEADDRFVPVEPVELPHLELEISVLSAPEPLRYRQPADLPRQLRPGVDGLILGTGRQQATFLPQVWARVPNPEHFVGLLCEKLGAPRDAWRRHRFEAARYTAESFCESDFPAEPGRDPPLPRRPD
jgi:AmmeMemoRadiSam system protein A